MGNTGVDLTNKFRFLSYKINMLSCYMICAWIAVPYIRINTGVIFMLASFIM